MQTNSDLFAIVAPPCYYIATIKKQINRPDKDGSGETQKLNKSLFRIIKFFDGNISKNDTFKDGNICTVFQ